MQNRFVGCEKASAGKKFACEVRSCVCDSDGYFRTDGEAVAAATM